MATPSSSSTGDAETDPGSVPSSSSSQAATLKLSTFPVNFSEQEFLVHPDDLPSLRPGDVLQVTLMQHQEQQDQGPLPPSLLLQVGADTAQAAEKLKIKKGSIYIARAVADCFGLKNFAEVRVALAAAAGTPAASDPSSPFALDSLELTFREQYLGRSEMWRIKSSLVGTAVFVGKKLDFFGGVVRCQAQDMWAGGEAVACGVVSEETKIVFRSPTAMVYLYIQMSAEMWTEDERGDLYWEKAVDGFLADMFERWRLSGSSHEVTIVLFSRCFYDSTSSSDFPAKTRSCVQRWAEDGSCYQDFFRVVVQNERFEDWTPTLLELRHAITDYREQVLDHHKDGDVPVPAARISTAEKGNFLEVLNMTLNTFENHFLNRNMERTGQQSIVLTPGVGVFEVEREMAQITKQRIIDSGVGSDLICLGQQPLHAVPLLRFVGGPGGVRSSSASGDYLGEDYSMPHWINLSYYSRSMEPNADTRVCRVRARPLPQQEGGAAAVRPRLQQSRHLLEKKDWDEIRAAARHFDSVVFAPPSPDQSAAAGEAASSAAGTPSRARQSRTRSQVFETIGESSVLNSSLVGSPSDTWHAAPNGGAAVHNRQDSSGSSVPVGSLDSNLNRSFGSFMGGGGGRSVNPFDPASGTKRVSSNRRRWTHIFPKAKGGDYVQPFQFGADGGHRAAGGVNGGGPVHPSLRPLAGVTRHEWSAESATAGIAASAGVDWKSLTTPASLPITTDYFPGERTINSEYTLNEYTLEPDVIDADLSRRSPYDRAPLSVGQVFNEMVSQRLAQGFQLILIKKVDEGILNAGLKDTPSKVKGRGGGLPRAKSLHGPESEDGGVSVVAWLSIGRIFHRVILRGKRVSVVIYRPKEKNFQIRLQYRYRFRAPDNDDYEVSWTGFRTEHLENYNWNVLDFYVCTQGDREFELTDQLKYWRFRMCAVPLAAASTASTKRIAERKEDRCDVYGDDGEEDHDDVAAFHRFIDSCLNKTKRRAAAAAMAAAEEKKELKEEQHPPLTRKTSKSEICKRMRDPKYGLNFFERTKGLPEHTFISYDAAEWAVRNVEEVSDATEAVSFFQRLIKEGAVCHASGDRSVPFKYGYVMYAVVPQSGGHKQAFPYAANPDAHDAFSDDWVEVEMDSGDESKDVGFVSVRLEPGAKAVGISASAMKAGAEGADRPEWAHLNYQRRRRRGADATFEMSLHWTVSTGACLGELAQGWSRKAAQLGFSLIPIPGDPFALPITENSDPVRGPIFVEMVRTKRKCSDDDVGEGAAEAEDDDKSRYFSLRDAIARRFGFVRCTQNAQLRRRHSSWSTDKQYIHYTGNMFLLIPTEIMRQTGGIQGVKDGGKAEEAADLGRSLSDRSKPAYDHSQTGFLWSWNFAISRKWKAMNNTGATGDIDFMDKMLLDFRAFCANQDGRLARFTEEFDGGRATNNE